MAWPTTSNPRTEFVTLRLTADEAARLDAYASALGMSRSAAVRDAVTQATSGAKKTKKPKK